MRSERLCRFLRLMTNSNLIESPMHRQIPGLLCSPSLIRSDIGSHAAGNSDWSERSTQAPPDLAIAEGRNQRHAAVAASPVSIIVRLCSS